MQLTFGGAETQAQLVPPKPTYCSLVGSSASTTVIVPVAAVRGPLLATTMVLVMLAPTATMAGDLLLLTERSSPSGDTVRLREAVLLAAFGSVGPPAFGAMVAVMPLKAVGVATVGAVATMVRVPLAPEARLPAKVQVTITGEPALTQVQPAEPVALVTVKPAGSGKVTLAPAVAGYGPPLLGCRTKVTALPETAGLGVGGLCVTARSVPGLTLTLATGLLFERSGSPTVEVMLPLSVIVPPPTPVTLLTIGRFG